MRMGAKSEWKRGAKRERVADEWSKHIEKMNVFYAMQK